MVKPAFSIRARRALNPVRRLITLLVEITTEMRNGTGVHELINNRSLPIPIGSSGRFKSDGAAIAKKVRLIEITGEDPSLLTL
jgi:hypothetical protein